MRVLALLACMSACGQNHAEPLVTRPLPPNTETACARARVCNAILAGQEDACVACLEHVDAKLEAQLVQQYGPIPPLDQLDCTTLTNVVQHGTNIGMCVVGRWYGP